jgi:hypothetical protein
MKGGTDSELEGRENRATRKSKFLYHQAGGEDEGTNGDAFHGGHVSSSERKIHYNKLLTNS